MTSRTSLQGSLVLSLSMVGKESWKKFCCKTSLCLNEKVRNICREMLIVYFMSRHTTQEPYDRMEEHFKNIKININIF